MDYPWGKNRTRSKAEVFEICRQTAMERYARCRSGHSDHKGPLYNGE